MDGWVDGWTAVWSGMMMTVLCPSKLKLWLFCVNKSVQSLVVCRWVDEAAIEEYECIEIKANAFCYSNLFVHGMEVGVKICCGQTNKCRKYTKKIYVQQRTDKTLTGQCTYSVA